MEKPKVHLHIGVNATETLTIQKWMAANEELLKQKSLLYPKSGRDGVTHHEFSSVFGFEKNSLNTLKPKRITRFQESLAKEIEHSQPHSILFSSECFMLNASLEPLAEFLSDYDCKILVVLQRHDYWWEDQFTIQSDISDNPILDIENFIWKKKQDNPLFNFKTLLDKWSDAFGKENIWVRPYEHLSDSSRKIVIDMLGFMGISDVDINCSSEKSFSPKSAYIKQIAKRAGLNEAHIKKLDQYLGESETDGSDRVMYLNSERRRIMIDYCEESQYQYIAQTYLNRPDGKLFYDSLPEENTVSFVPPEPEELVKNIVSAIRKIN